MLRMDIFGSNNEDRISSLDTWKLYAPPAQEKHWRKGRSAYELASAWIEGEAEESVTDLLSLRPELAGIELLRGVGEKLTQFDENPKGPRNHDLLLQARCDDGPVVIGLEAKADEPFGEPLWLTREKALADSPNSGVPARIDGLTNFFFGSTMDEDDGSPALKSLPYQLLFGLAGTLTDAKEASAGQAVFLVEEFATDLTSPEKRATNDQDYEAFMERIFGDSPDRKSTDNGWITDPVLVRGDGRWMPEKTEVFFAKLTHYPA